MELLNLGLKGLMSSHSHKIKPLLQMGSSQEHKDLTGSADVCIHNIHCANLKSVALEFLN